MKWQSVDAVCNCNARVQSFSVTVISHDVDDLEEAKRQVREAITEHVENEEYCTMDSISGTVYYEDEFEVSKQ